ncbi:MAG TPA: STAS domain-containing protein [Myxococcales bacterium]|jgi:anti-anti-sigma regulatory factor|nr:STAS domain-containing protein [Myxococcales bacterium]
MQSRNEALFSLEGTFDHEAARRLRAMLLASSARGATIDFSRVVSFDDSALAPLTGSLIWLRRQGREVIVRGLREHQVNLLNHLGVHVADDGSASASAEEEMPFPD